MTFEDWKVNLPAGSKGNIEIRPFEVPEFSITNMRYALDGRAAIPGQYTALYRNNALWMSDTTAEVRDHLEVDYQIRRRGGRILVMGLGLGMIVKRALSYENVEHVDVVEIDPDVAVLVGQHYESERCTIHLADAYEIKWPPNTHWNVAWHDIWLHMSEDNLPEMARLARSYGRRVDWQGFWAKEYILRRRRQESRSSWGW